MMQREYEEGAVVPFAQFPVSSSKNIVDGIPTDRRVVLLGESTHGTEEFYRTRVEITKRLIEERGFTAVIFEADWPFMRTANQYTHSVGAEPASPFPQEIRFPEWMWKNQVMVEFFDWCKERHCRLLQSHKAPELFGMDCYSLFESKNDLIKFLEEHDKAFAQEVKERLKYLDKYETGHEYGRDMVHGNMSRAADHIQDVLTKIQSRLQWGSDKYACSDVERLCAEQNCEVVIAADEYYKKCVSEPAGSQASWNARDQHMTTTLLRIQAHLDDPKIIVWAHNSHIGDSTATDRGGASFDKNETWNLGQMVRATFGHDVTWVVGQYTYDGTVTAAHNWGGPHEAHTLNPAHQESYEGKLHSLVCPTLEESSFCFNTAAFAEASEPSVVEAVQAGDAVATQLQELLQGPARLQRWVGVNYRPDTEMQSHYGKLMLAKCYDQVVFVDRTSALQGPAPGFVNLAQRTKAQEAANDTAAGPGGAVSAAAAHKRLLKEYRNLRRSPPQGIEATPLESNILEWHFVLTCEQPPYANGQYHGALVFPPEYPMRPPQFKVFTPSGRFEPGERLCLSMSDYHPETWNPGWSVETLLVGLLSFMYEESYAIGSIERSTAERERLAAKSLEFNQRNRIWKELFSGDGGASVLDDDDDGFVEKATESTCRFCFSSGGELISPCMCKGSNEWVHLECLRDWQRNVLLTQPTHPKYQSSIDRICNVCLEPFTGVGIPPSRLEQIKKFTGNEIATMVQKGNLLVSTRESSRENLEIITQHPEIKDRLSTWTKAVFLMISTGSKADPHLIAVSMSVPLAEGPPRDVLASMRPAERATWTSLPSTVRHFDGGPMRRTEPFAVAHVRGDPDEISGLAQSNGVGFVTPGWFVGNYQDVTQAIANLTQSGVQLPAIVNLVWGCGGWGHTQVLAEIARGGWGLVKAEDYLAIRPDQEMEIDWLLDFEWNRIIPLGKLAPRTEYTSRRKR